MNWERVDELVDGAASVEGLVEHRLGAFAAARRRAAGAAVAPELVEQETLGLMAAVAAPATLERVAAILDEPLVVLKGPVLAARYPAPQLRPYLDLDLIVADPAAAQERLLAAGARYALDEAAPADGHHERELQLPGLSLAIELHSFPRWPAGATPPRAPELLALGRPDPALPDGVLALPAAEHAVVVAGHSWAHRPLRRVRDLIDVAVLADAADPAALEAAAARWGVARAWRTLTAAIDALLGEQPGRAPLAMRFWARDLAAVRRRRLHETALEHLLGEFWSMPPAPAARVGLDRFGAALRRRAPAGRD